MNAVSASRASRPIGGASGSTAAASRPPSASRASAAAVASETERRPRGREGLARRAEQAALRRIEPGGPVPRERATTAGARVEPRREPRGAERDQLEGAQRGGRRRPRVEPAEVRDEQLEELVVRLVVANELARELRRVARARDPREVAADPAERLDGRDRVEAEQLGPGALPDLGDDERERLERAAESPLRRARAAGIRRHLAALAGEERHDPVRLAGVDEPEDDAGELRAARSSRVTSARDTAPTRALPPPP